MFAQCDSGGRGLHVRVLSGLAVAVSATAAAPLFGTLMSNSANSVQEYSAGLRQVGHECFWDRVETSDGVWSETELQWKLTERDAFLKANMSLVLEPGLHEPPAYLLNLPNANFISNNNTNSSSGYNSIWSTEVRNRVERYITKLASVLDFSKYHSIRLGGAGWVEVLYPAGNLYWGYDPVAQSTCPYPGWRPGDTSLNASQVAEWYNWYLDSMVGEIKWRHDLFRSLNFSGSFHLVMPGTGAVPIVAQSSIDANLTLYADTMGRGASWYLLLSRLVKQLDPATTSLFAWCSSTAEALRQNDTTQPGDDSVDPYDPVLNTWSSMRQMSYNADKLGLQKGGENPGYGDSENYGLPMLQAAVAQMEAGGWSMFSWAHDSDLYTPSHGLNLSQYADVIANWTQTRFK